MKGGIVVVSGHSGAGKTTLRQMVEKRVSDLWFSVSCTTRQPRPGEKHGKDYYFVSREEFERMARAGEFLEWAEYSGNLYGTPKGPVMEKYRQGKIVYIEVEVQGFLQIREKVPWAVSVFIAAPSLSELERRLRQRGTETEEVLRKRVERAREEMRFAREYDYLIVNEDLEEAASLLSAILLSSKAKLPSLDDFLEKWEKS